MPPSTSSAGANDMPANPNPIKRCAFLGECMVELQGQPFEGLQQTMGGDTLNTAVYFARCSRRDTVSTAYATALGTDRFSDAMLSRWQDEGIAIDLVRRLPDRLPGMYYIELEPGGERRFHFWREQSAARAYFDGDSSPLEDAADRLELLYLSGISLAILPIAARERVLALMARVQRHGGQVAVDSNYRARLWPQVQDARHWITRALAAADIGLVTTDDHMALHGLDSEAAALEHAAALGCAELVLKCGPRPTRVRSAGVWTEVATVRVTTVVDTTAAGDAFGGAYLSRRLAGESPALAAAFGNRVAARVIQYPGALIDRQRMGDLMP